MSDRNIDTKTEKPSGTGTQIGSLADLGLGLIDSAIAKPYNATIGLIAPKIDLSNDYNHNSIAAKVAIRRRHRRCAGAVQSCRMGRR